MERTRFEEVNLIKLTEAFLCANCELIVSESVNGGCPACGSRAMLSVSKALGGTVENSQSVRLAPGTPASCPAGWEN